MSDNRASHPDRDAYLRHRRRKWDLLIAALRHGPLTVTTLSERLGWGRGATEAAVRRIEDAGLITRSRSPRGYVYTAVERDSAPEAVAARITPHKGQIVPSRTPPEWKPLNRDPYRIMKLAMLTR